MIAFHLSCIPPKTTHQHKKVIRVGKWNRIGDKPELEDAKAMIDSLLIPHRPASPVSGAVCLRLEYTWPWLASHPKRTKALGKIPHTSRPDCSNLAKTFEDRLVALRFMEDDNAVVELTVVKFWGDEPGISVLICPYGEEVTMPQRVLMVSRTGLFADAPEEPVNPSISDA